MNPVLRFNDKSMKILFDVTLDIFSFIGPRITEKIFHFPCVSCVFGQAAVVVTHTNLYFLLYSHLQRTDFIDKITFPEG